MSGPVSRYYDQGDEEELMQLLALLIAAREQFVREECYATASAIGEWVEEMRDRLVGLIALRQADALRAE